MELTSKKQKYITYLKAIASFLITNSHCRDIYPLFFLAVGGSHGNAIFFLVSGFCLANIKADFLPWIKKRMERLALPLLIATIIGFTFVDRWVEVLNLSVLEVVYLLVNRYWFIFAIALFYPLFYFIFNKRNIKMIKVAVILHAIIYFLIYFLCIDKTTFSVETEGFALFKVYFYFGIFIMGGLIRFKLNSINGMINKNKRKILIIAGAGIAVSCLCWASVYVLIMVVNKLYILQFLIQISVYAFSVCIFIFAMIIISGNTISSKLFGFVDKCIEQISNSTLEIYLIQVTLKPLIINYNFPVNWILFFLIAFGGGVAFHSLTEKLFDTINVKTKMRKA